MKLEKMSFTLVEIGKCRTFHMDKTTIVWIMWVIGLKRMYGMDCYSMDTGIQSIFLPNSWKAETVHDCLN